MPLSARMLSSLEIYSRLLKAYSQPRTALLDYVLDDESQTILIRSHQPWWLYASFDATALCEFILACIEECVEQDLAHEVKYLQAYDSAVARLEAWLDLPQPKLSLLIRLVAQGHGEISQRKRKIFEELPRRSWRRLNPSLPTNSASIWILSRAAIEVTGNPNPTISRSRVASRVGYRLTESGVL